MKKRTWLRTELDEELTASVREILNDEREVKRRRLFVPYGMDFGEPGKRDMDAV